MNQEAREKALEEANRQLRAVGTYYFDLNGNSLVRFRPDIEAVTAYVPLAGHRAESVPFVTFVSAAGAKGKPEGAAAPSGSETLADAIVLIKEDVAGYLLAKIAEYEVPLLGIVVRIPLTFRLFPSEGQTLWQFRTRLAAVPMDWLEAEKELVD